MCHLWQLIQSHNYVPMFYSTNNNTSDPKPADNLDPTTFIMLAIVNVSNMHPADAAAAADYFIVVVGATAGSLTSWCVRAVYEQSLGSIESCAVAHPLNASTMGKVSRNNYNLNQHLRIKYKYV